MTSSSVTNFEGRAVCLSGLGIVGLLTGLSVTGGSCGSCGSCGCVGCVCEAILSSTFFKKASARMYTSCAILKLILLQKPNATTPIANTKDIPSKGIMNNEEKNPITTNSSK